MTNILDKRVDESEIDFKRRCFSFIRDVVCNYYGVSVERLHEVGRKADVVKVRHTTIYFCLLLVNKVNLSELGNFIGCNHATVIHARRKLTGYLQFDAELKKEYDELNKIIVARNAGLKYIAGDEGRFVDLNNCVSFRIGERSIVLSGYGEKDIQEFMKRNELNDSQKMIHKNSGVYIIEKNGN